MLHEAASMKHNEVIQNVLVKNITQMPNNKKYYNNWQGNQTQRF